MLRTLAASREVAEEARAMGVLPQLSEHLAVCPNACHPAGLPTAAPALAARIPVFVDLFLQQCHCKVPELFSSVLEAACRPAGVRGVVGPPRDIFAGAAA